MMEINFQAESDRACWELLARAKDLHAALRDADSRASGCFTLLIMNI